ncbi:MAG TPA: hypothetical protein VGR16_07590 [Thermomicrobiales bacterium]|nr:hypothetical protein [Thermomicrobiales bacterium]
MVTMLVSLIALVGMVSSGPATPLRDQERDPESETAEYRFGRVVTVFTVICGIVLAGIIVAGIFSFFGGFTEELIDPPV